MLQSTLKYDVWLVEEIAGMRADTRNLIAVPSSRASLFEGSSILDFACTARRMLPVTNETIQHLAFPCCRPGRLCCPSGLSRHGHIMECCTHKLVHAWMAKAIHSGGLDLQWSTRLQWYDNRIFRYQDATKLALIEAKEMNRLPQLSGFAKPGASQSALRAWSSCINGSCLK
jgi:hypothetical protein